MKLFFYLALFFNLFILGCQKDSVDDTPKTSVVSEKEKSNDVNNPVDNNENPVSTTKDEPSSTKISRPLTSSVIIYATDGITEVSKSTFSYDDKGRDAGISFYNNGKLSLKTRDYTFEGNTATYYTDNYTDGSISSSYKSKRTYLNNSSLSTSVINYSTDGITQVSKSTFSYDDKGRDAGISFYNNGKLSLKTRDYTFEGNTASYYTDNYTDGSISSTNKNKRTYLDNSSLTTSIITYATDGITEVSKSVFSYDDQGREAGVSFYNNGKPSLKTRDYTFEGNTATYYTDNYTDGSISSSYKSKRTYITN